MIKLLKIELKKINTYKVFWAMVILYVLAVVFIFFGFPSLIDYFSLKSDASEVKLLKNFIYNFPDIWQNLSWVASLRFFIKIFLGIIIIILVCNEYNYLTIRHNVINGLSRSDLLKSKLYLIITFAIFSTLIIVISGIILGYSFSSTTAIDMVVKKTSYLLGYFVEIFTYMTFALFLALLLKKTGLAVSILFIYPIIELIVSQQLNEKIEPYLPMNAMNHVIRTPNTSLIQYSSPSDQITLQIAIGWQDIAVCLLYAALFITISAFILKKRDL